MAKIITNKNIWLKVLLAVLVLVGLGFFFSYKLLQVPTGLTSDEGAFGYNATLLSRTLKDENGRTLPFFVNSIGGRDWRQPVEQYYVALFFKLFGASEFNLRFSSVVLTLISTVLIYGLSSKIFDQKKALLVSAVFVTSPLIMIQSHMGLDNITPVPLALLWLLALWNYHKTFGKKWLIVAALSLGLALYSYKGLRATVPVWSLLTLLFIWWCHKWKINKKLLVDGLIFSGFLAPFFLIVPYLNFAYPGSIFGGSRPEIKNWYDFFYPYLSSFDPSFLFIKGDELVVHSTQRHGMLLFATLPLFLIGSYQIVKQKGFGMWLLGAFFSAPFLYGTIGSIHRASRLMVLIPIYALVCGYGIKVILEKRKTWILVIGFFIALNYWDFLHYYWYVYPGFSRGLFGDLTVCDDYKIVGNSIDQNTKVYIPQRYISEASQTDLFCATSYIKQGFSGWSEDGELPPEGSVLIHYRDEIPGFEPQHLNLPHLKLFKRI